MNKKEHIGPPYCVATFTGKSSSAKKKSKWYLSPKLIFYFSFQSKSSPLYWSVKWYPYIWIRRCHPFIFYPSSNTVLFYSQSTVQNIPTNNCWNFKFKFYIVKWQKAEFLSLKMIFLLACEFSSWADAYHEIFTS